MIGLWLEMLGIHHRKAVCVSAAVRIIIFRAVGFHCREPLKDTKERFVGRRGIVSGGDAN